MCHSWASYDAAEQTACVSALFDTIKDHIKPKKVPPPHKGYCAAVVECVTVQTDTAADFKMLVSMMEYDQYVGR